jgi:hypothetical protein
MKELEALNKMLGVVLAYEPTKKKKKKRLVRRSIKTKA